MPDQVPPHMLAIIDRLRAHAARGAKEATEVNVVLAYDLVADMAGLFKTGKEVVDVTAWLDERVRPEHRDKYLVTLVSMMVSVCEDSDCAYDTLQEIVDNASNKCGIPRDWRKLHGS